ncbi:chymotrypsin inhibitor 3-like [Vigna unguiculata]|uniref:chymotrypsin inhibitor 3-like n=1 Tax=Vigna unguiculata TaxID=3917 RepID=UPI0010160DF5|nr:chymotrypsin inhibitor 3-like [Vigna unguiculata]
MASATLFALFLLSVLTFYSPSTTAQPVTDGYGVIVPNGARFHILPPTTIAGGIRRVKTNNETVALSVVRSPIETDKGEPITITSPYGTEYLSEGPVTISFEYSPYLGVASLEWTAVEGQRLGTVVKVRGYPNTLRGGYSIKSAGKNRYKLLFCRGVLCGNVVIINDYEGHWLLAVTQNEAYAFVLEQIRSTSSDSE